MTKSAKVPNTPSAQENARPDPERDRMELVRFRTKEDLRKALGIFRHTASNNIYFTFGKEPDTCITNTETVRALLRHGVNLEWLTENLPS